jgi:ABC-type phosphate transport system substrate-binding protein
MKSSLVLALGLLVIALYQPVPAAALNESLVIVVNKSNTIRAMTLSELRRIFTKQKRFWSDRELSDRESIVPIDWEATSEVRKSFSKYVLGKSVLEMREFWVLQSMTVGLSAPITQKSTKAILRFVANVPGAISYVPANEVDLSVKSIRVRDWNESDLSTP